MNSFYAPLKISRIAWSPYADLIHFGWFTMYSDMQNPDPGYISNSFDINTGFSYPINTFAKVANTTNYSGTMDMAFAKQQDHIPDMFCVYALFTGTSQTYYLGLKYVPWLNIAFKAPPDDDPQPVSDTKPGVYPNPLHNTVRFSTNADPDQHFHLAVFDLPGRQVFSERGTLPGLESRINAILPDLPAQPYIFRFWDDAGLCRTVKVVKQ